MITHIGRSIGDFVDVVFRGVEGVVFGRCF